MVFLSILVAVIAGFAALTIVDRMRVIDRGESTWWGWLIFGSITLGIGIWAMHFTGMIAYQTSISIDYGLSFTFLSILPATLGGGFAVYYMSFRYDEITLVQTWMGALFLATGIGGMHYLGMEAMKMKAYLRYDFFLFVLSLLVAFVLALLAFYAKFFLVADDESEALNVNGTTWLYRGMSATLVGGAIAGMHYTAMTATRLYPDKTIEVQAGMGFPPELMGFAIGGFVTVYLGGVIITVLISKNLAVRKIISDQAEAIAVGNFNSETLNRDAGGRLGRAFRMMVKNLRTAARQAQSISKGDLGDPILDETVRGDFGESFERMVDQLTELISQLKQSGKRLERISEEIRSTSDALHDSSEELSQATESAYRTTREGQDVVREMTETMNRITEDSEEIQIAVDLIDDIANRTKLLSLNAAVEAAKAGEEGEGFAVVAEEVGELARQSKEAAETIHETIQSSVDRTKKGAKKAEKSEQALDDIGDQIQKVTQQMEQISSAETRSNSEKNESAGFTTSAEAGDHEPRSSESRSSVDQLLEQAEAMEQIVEKIRTSVDHFTLLEEE
jgi:methyl-accepting chemotaxis protein